MGYVMPKQSLCSGTILTMTGDKRVYTFQKGINSKVIVTNIAELKSKPIPQSGQLVQQNY